METTNIPKGYQQIMPYLIVANAADFIGFMQVVFGAKEKLKVMRDESKIMHGELNIGNSCIMFADATDEFSQQNAGLFIYVDDCDSVYQKALDNRAKKVMEPAEQEYGRSAGIIDPFGNTWWITSVGKTKS